MGCSGVCCAAFPWKRSPAQLVVYPAEAGGSTQAESRYIADMLVPLSPEQAKARHERFGVGYARTEYGRAVASGRYWYTCKHWNEDTKLCGAYDDRPMMCREFPYDNECEHGCGQALDDAARAVYDRRQIEDGWGPLEIVLGEN
jgi:Fe-S-cluster containining protein